MGETARMGCVDFGGREDKFESSTMAPLSPWEMVVTSQDFDEDRVEKASDIRDDDDFCWELG